MELGNTHVYKARYPAARPHLSPSSLPDLVLPSVLTQRPNPSATSKLQVMVLSSMQLRRYLCLWLYLAPRALAQDPSLGLQTSADIHSMGIFWNEDTFEGERRNMSNATTFADNAPEAMLRTDAREKNSVYRNISGESTLKYDACAPMSCTLYAPSISVVSWVPEEQIRYTSDVTVGVITTIVLLCSNVVMATKIQTDYDWGAAPAGMYPPYLTTNDYGNAVAVAAFTNAAATSVVELVYPNSHLAYETTFSWEGNFMYKTNYYDSYGPALHASADPNPSMVDLGKYSPFPRAWYPEPTATRPNGSHSLGKEFRPMWVPLDLEPFHDFFLGFYWLYNSSDTNRLAANAFRKCSIVFSATPTPSIFYEPSYQFHHRTISIDLDAPIPDNNNIPARRWRNSTASGTLCMDHILHFTSLCEKPDVSSSRHECANTTTIFLDAEPTEEAGMPLLFEGCDRMGFPFRPQTATGFETAYSTEDSATPFYFAPDDWTPDEHGGIVTTPASPVTPAYRDPDASEAAVIFAFLKSHTEELRVGSWKPQQTQPPTRSAEALKPINPEAVSQYFKEPLGYPAQPSGDRVAPSGRLKAAGLDAIGSAFNRIFFQRISTNQPHSRISTVDAYRIGFQSAATTLSDKDVPTLMAAAQAVHGAADISVGATPTTSRDYLYIQVSTTINDVPTAIGGYVLPMTSTVMAGQQVTVDGQATQLPIPDLLPTFLSMAISGLPSSTIGYIISGRSVATIGQTINLNGESTVLATPDAVFVLLPTTGMNGISMTTPAYIISGSSTASIGQRVTLNGTPTILAAPGLVPTYITATTSGVEGSGLAFIITGSMTATVGQTVTIGGSTTVLAEPTSQPGVVEGGTRRSRGTCNAVLLGIGAAFVAWL